MAGSVAQRMAALNKANAVRVNRADLKRGFRDGNVTLRDVLGHDELPGYLREVLAIDLLRMQPRIGKVRAKKMCFTAGVRENRALSELTARQREALLALAPR